MVKKEKTIRLSLCLTVLAAQYLACNCAQQSSVSRLHLTSPQWKLSDYSHSTSTWGKHDTSMSLVVIYHITVATTIA